MPEIYQNITKSGRVGCEIKPDHGVFKGFINFHMPKITNPPTPTPPGQFMVPTYIKVWIVDVKNSWDDCSNGDLNPGALPRLLLKDFLMNPEGSVCPLFPDMRALLFDTNNAKYRVKMTKLIKLSAQIQGWHPALLDSATNPPPQNYAFKGAQAVGGEGEFSKSFYFDYTKHMKKSWKYTGANECLDDQGNPIPIPNSGQFPGNQALWIIFQPIFSDGSTMVPSANPQTPTGNSLSTEIHFINQIKYTDA